MEERSGRKSITKSYTFQENAKESETYLQIVQAKSHCRYEIIFNRFFRKNAEKYEYLLPEKIYIYNLIYII